MAFEKNKFQVVQKKNLQKSEINVECNIPVEVEIEKIFSVSHIAEIESVEVQAGAAVINGAIDLSLLCQTIDGEFLRVNSSCPFNTKVDDKNIDANDKLNVCCEISNYSVDSIAGANIKIGCVVVLQGEIYKTCDIDTVGSCDDTICSKCDEISVSTFIGENQQTFVEENNFAIKEAISKIVVCESFASIKTVESGVDFVSVAGEIVSRIVYYTENEKYETMFATEQFKEEIELVGVTRESLSVACVSVIAKDLKCEMENVEKGVSVKISTPIKISVKAFEEKKVEVIKDVYSTTNELSVSTESFVMTKAKKSECFESKIDGELSLDENDPRIDKVLFVAGTNLYISNTYLQNGEIFVEGIAKANVVYLNDEVGFRSVDIEVPFVTSTKSDIECDSASVMAYAVLCDVDVSAKKGRYLYFDGKLKICANCMYDETSAVICDIAMGEEIERDYEVELVFANAGTESWEIAKEHKVREDFLIMQNPEISFPLTKDEKIIIYFQK